MADIVTTQITASALVVYGMELLKKASWLPWINRSTDTVNRIVAGTLAVGTALGIHTKFDPQHGTLLITGLTLASIAHFGFDWVRSFVFQEMIYKGVIKPRMVTTDQVHTSTVEADRRVERTVLQSQSQAATA
jgi:hypothetical protein